MSAPLHGLSLLLSALALLCAARALPPLFRPFRAGVPWWYGGAGWFGAPSRHMPDDARPHARAAVRRWAAAIGLLGLAGMAGIAAGEPQ